MGCHSHGPKSTEMFRSVSEMQRADLEALVAVVFDLRPSEIPEWADWDFYRQVMIDLTAVRAGEIKPQAASWYDENAAFKRVYSAAPSA